MANSKMPLCFGCIYWILNKGKYPPIFTTLEPITPYPIFKPSVLNQGIKNKLRAGEPPILHLDHACFHG